MLVLKRHPLVRADLQAAFDWYEDEQAGLAHAFAVDFRNAYRRLREGPLLYAIRFADVRRVNFSRFPYGIFYTLKSEELIVIAVLHASRDTEAILGERRKRFQS